ncbi:MAG: SH3 domain-containing protein [Colwellia sp.]
MNKISLLTKLMLSLFSVVLFSTCSFAKVPNYHTDVIDITEAHLSPSYWLSQLEQKNVLLMSQQDIAAFNQQLVKKNPYISLPLSVPNPLSKTQLVEKLTAISKPSKHARFYSDGTQVSDENYQTYIDATNQSGIKLKNIVQYGLVVKRTALRTFPTKDRIFKAGSDRDLDRFQESALFPGEAVAILHTSKDEQWLLVQAYNYLAWVQKSDVAVGNKTEITAFLENEDFIVVTGSKVFTNYVPNHEKISNVQLDMGTRLPLAKRSDYGNSVYGQNPFANYIVKLPVKDSQGKLALKLTPIPRGQDVRVGYLPFTKANLIKQSFKFLGERYGWGHDYNGRDCTGFVGEIYKSFGFIMPRNSGQQAKSVYGLNHFFAKDSDQQSKLKIIATLQVGDLIYIPGHVMMYLGDDKSKPYVIHDVKGLSYLDKQGDIYQGTLNGVSVTPLIPLKDYVKKITNIKRIRAK